MTGSVLYVHASDEGYGFPALEGKAIMPRIAALPFHGEIKLRREGIRTRDGHVMKWLAREYGFRIEIYSRPEPWPRVSLARRKGRTAVPREWHFHSPQVLAIPPLRSRRQWWVKSIAYRTRLAKDCRHVIVWNPILGAAMVRDVTGETTVVLDLLDDWTIHPLFAGFRKEIENSYAYLFSRADAVTANSEGTLRLSHQFGRHDAVLVPNGCDPEQFSSENRSEGPLTVGYAGKLGFRIDWDLILRAAQRFPKVQFRIAGPILDMPVRRLLRDHANIVYLGDLHYDDYRLELTHWDIAWVPHKTGPAEVGGDAIKVYEYRAAGLPTLSTPIIGTHRALPGVRVVEQTQMLDVLGRILENQVNGRVPREKLVLPPEVTWRFKASVFRELLETQPP